MANTESQRNPVELLAEEFLECYRLGQLVSISTFVARYPEHAKEIQELFPALVLMEKAGEANTQRLSVDARNQVSKAPDLLGVPSPAWVALSI